MFKPIELETLSQPKDKILLFTFITSNKSSPSSSDNFETNKSFVKLFDWVKLLKKVYNFLNEEQQKLKDNLWSILQSLIILLHLLFVTTKVNFFQCFVLHQCLYYIYIHVRKCNLCQSAFILIIFANSLQSHACVQVQ